MVEQILDTLRGIISYELPKNANSIPVVYDIPITGWLYGDSDISAVKIPTIVMNAANTEIKDLVTNTKEITYNVKIGLYVMSGDVEKSNRNIFELTRLVYESLLNHRYIWVVLPCPICSKKIFTPEHYKIAHATLMAPYLTTAQSNFNTLWSSTKTSTPPTLSDSRLSAKAFDLLITDVENNVVVANLTTNQKNNVLKNIAQKRRNTRLLFNAVCSSIKVDEEGKENLHAASFEFTAKELIYQTAYGPDNVPTTVFAL